MNAATARAILTRSSVRNCRCRCASWRWPIVFDAMTSVRPYRESLSLGSALSDLVRMSPQKYDPNVVQALLIQVRRDAVGSNRAPLLADIWRLNIAPGDVDQLGRDAAA